MTSGQANQLDPGDKVICIDTTSKGQPDPGVESHIQLGEIYEVAKVGGYGTGVIFIYVRGCKSCGYNKSECGWKPTRFSKCEETPFTPEEIASAVTINPSDQLEEIRKVML